MSRSNTTKFIARIFIFLVCAVFVGAESIVFAQNSNSSTTMPDDTSAQNSNMSNTNTNRVGRRRRRGRRPAANMNAGDTTAAETTAAPAEMAATMPAQTGRCDPMAQTQADLSGTYTGTVNYPEGGLTGDATLTINGNDFTLTAGSTTQQGRVVAVTTCNYTGVTMMFGPQQTTAPTGPQPKPLPVVSLEAKRRGNGLTLTSVAGESRQFSFGSAAAGGGSPRYGGRRGGRRRGRSGMSMPVGIKPPTAMQHIH